MCHKSRQQAIDMAEGQIEVLVYVDEDDPLKNEYRDVIIGKPLHSGKAMRHLVDIAKGDILFFGCDDFEWKTRFWNTIFEETMPSHGLSVSCPSDLPNGKNKSMSPAFTKRFVEEIGYWDERFQHFGPDTWMIDVARRAGTLIFVKNVHISHAKVGDATYKRARENNDGSNAMKILNETVDKRQKMADKIKTLV